MYGGLCECLCLPCSVAVQAVQKGCSEGTSLLPPPQLLRITSVQVESASAWLPTSHTTTPPTATQPSPRPSPPPRTQSRSSPGTARHRGTPPSNPPGKCPSTTPDTLTTWRPLMSNASPRSQWPARGGGHGCRGQPRCSPRDWSTWRTFRACTSEGKGGGTACGAPARLFSRCVG